jgi:Ca2+-binding RTX toxin-like protein
MVFRVFRDRAATSPVGDFATLAQALAAMDRNFSLMLPADLAVTGPIPIATDRATLWLGQAGSLVTLGAGVGTFWLQGSVAVTVNGAATGGVIHGHQGSLVFAGGGARDDVRAGAAADVLLGFGGNDILSGGGDSDLLDGGAGRDRLSGGAGDDLILTGSDRDTVTGGSGADRIEIDTRATGSVLITDFDAAAGDRLALTGDPALSDFAQVLARAQISQTSAAAVLTLGTIRIEVQGATTAVFQPGAFDFAPPSFDSLAQFLASPLAARLTEVMIGDTLYRLRATEPVHEDFKGQDGQGRWWSPDYFVVVAAGQSNMEGSGTGGDMTLSGNVAAWDWFNGDLIQADYLAAPANGPGVRSGTAIRNNLYFPFAEAAAADLGRPVLVIAHPIPGSRIDSWLETGQGQNWQVLQDDIADALAAVGQRQADAFLWLQGESDFPVPTAEFQALFLQFVAQVRAQEWAGAEMAFLAGELSRQGLNWVQNRAFQAIEEANPDALLRFVSSAGLTASHDPSGIHFDGPSLNDYGLRFWQAWLQAAGLAPEDGANTAPVLAPGATPPVAITMQEGETLDLAVAQYFADAEGDDLFFYSYLSRRAQDFDLAQDGVIRLTPGYDSAGVYRLTVYANDHRLDGASFEVQVTVTDRAPGLALHSNFEFDNLLSHHANFASVAPLLKANRGVDILLQQALGPGPTVLSHDSLRLRGADGLTGDFRLAEAAGLTRVFLYGAADFRVTGNSLDNLFEGNAGDNRLTGLGGRDRLNGWGGDDVLIGGAGDDTLQGGEGADVLDAGAGADHAWGGTGADLFVFRAGEGSLLIRDLGAGDRVQVAGFAGIEDFRDLLDIGLLWQSGTRAILDIGADRLMFDNTSVAAVTAGLFEFG